MFASLSSNAVTTLGNKLNDSQGMWVQDKQKKAKKITKAQAARQATRSYAGKVLKVDLKGDYYRVKVHQSSGRVVFVMVDAYTGKVSR
ncbi:PepSY domain-containing protein [Glaciecola sp. MH2013]|uniref:PepSY domain-containing protein n=1 Tax=Glaciecola sp. MH2013 TaxID=2785524 RepID=UPI001E4E68E3|nr:PepSY domain-containing protein [Glaciecola sp. MH2013]